MKKSRFTEEQIIGFLKQAEAGMPLVGSAVTAARMRLRPILMTSLAFILGVLPLMLSKGAGAGAQNALGTAVVGGMVSGTVLAIFFVPLFFCGGAKAVWAQKAGHGQRRAHDFPRFAGGPLRCLVP